jgi:hypothetical protein
MIINLSEIANLMKIINSTDSTTTMHQQNIKRTNFN